MQSRCFGVAGREDAPVWQRPPARQRRRNPAALAGGMGMPDNRYRPVRGGNRCHRLGRRGTTRQPGREERADTRQDTADARRPSAPKPAPRNETRCVTRRPRPSRRRVTATARKASWWCCTTDSAARSWRCTSGPSWAPACRRWSPSASPTCWRPASGDPAWIVRVLGLTQAEARVAAGLFDGLDLREIAERQAVALGDGARSPQACDDQARRAVAGTAGPHTGDEPRGGRCRHHHKGCSEAASLN